MRREKRAFQRGLRKPAFAAEIQSCVAENQVFNILGPIPLEHACHVGVARCMHLVNPVVLAGCVRRNVCTRAGGQLARLLNPALLVAERKSKALKREIAFRIKSIFSVAENPTDPQSSMNHEQNCSPPCRFTTSRPIQGVVLVTRRPASCLGQLRIPPNTQPSELDQDMVWVLLITALSMSCSKSKYQYHKGSEFQYTEFLNILSQVLLSYLLGPLGDI